MNYDLHKHRFNVDLHAVINAMAAVHIFVRKQRSMAVAAMHRRQKELYVEALPQGAASYDLCQLQVPSITQVAPFAK